MTTKWTIATGLSLAIVIFASGLASAAGQRQDRPRACEPSPSSNASVSGALFVSVPHRLSKPEALRRLKTGLAGLQKDYGFLFTLQEESWTGYQLRFRASVLGQLASGTIDVTDRQVCLEVFLPWLLAPFAEAAKPVIIRHGTSMLEKK